MIVLSRLCGINRNINLKTLDGVLMLKISKKRKLMAANRENAKSGGNVSMAQGARSRNTCVRCRLPNVPNQESINFALPITHQNICALCYSQLQMPNALHSNLLYQSAWPPQPSGFVYFPTVPAQLQQYNLISVIRNAAIYNSDQHVKNHAPKAVETIGTGHRKWERTTAGIAEEGHKKKNSKVFKVMSYNVLAQELLDTHKYLYRTHKGMHLNWAFRWENLQKEIDNHRCDIVCLQELQKSHYDQYAKFFNGIGYNGIYKKRTREYPDGCAIFYKRKKFKLIEHITVEYLQPFTSVLDRDNVGIIAKFAPLENKVAEFIVATTHLLYNPKRDDVRLAQIQLFLAEIERMSYKRTGDGYLPVILTGDFNSRHDSDVVNFLENAYLNLSFIKNKRNKLPELISSSLGITDNCQHIELKEKRENNVELSRSDEVKLLQISHSQRAPVNNQIQYVSDDFHSGTLRHMFNLRSVYNQVVNSKIEATTFQNEWLTVDYIFYSGKKEDDEVKEDKLVLLSRYALPFKNDLEGVCIPNDQLGSDHLSLLATFKLRF